MRSNLLKLGFADIQGGLDKMNSGGNDLFNYIQEGIRMSEEMLAMRFIAMSLADKFHFAEYLG